MILVTKTSDQARQRVCMYYSHYIYHSMDQPGKAALPARCQLNRIFFSRCPRGLIYICRDYGRNTGTFRLIF